MLDDNSIDSIVTDSPYEMGFMNKKWDKTGIAYNIDLWKECLRVLKPGGYLLSFGGARTYHRMVCVIEDAGFIIHPLIAWINGQGFPKATSLSKQFDKQEGAKGEIIGTKKGAHNNPKGFKYDNHGQSGGTFKNVYDLTTHATSEAKQWDGWYYGLQSLKPAIEPICMAQKPIDGKRMTDNVQKWGTGAINIGDCRIGDFVGGWQGNPSKGYSGRLDADKSGEARPTEGRFPANVIFDEFAGEILDKQSGIRPSGKGNGSAEVGVPTKGQAVPSLRRGKLIPRNDSGGASRFFKNIEYIEDDFVGFYYCAKASRKERGEYNNHTSVKPIKLIKYLVRLITPPEGICLDPFIGSGTTALACIKEGFNYIGFEISGEYCNIAKKRIKSISE